MSRDKLQIVPSSYKVLFDTLRELLGNQRHQNYPCLVWKGIGEWYESMRVKPLYLNTRSLGGCLAMEFGSKGIVARFCDVTYAGSWISSDWIQARQKDLFYVSVMKGGKVVQKRVADLKDSDELVTGFHDVKVYKERQLPELKEDEVRFLTLLSAYVWENVESGVEATVKPSVHYRLKDLNICEVRRIGNKTRLYLFNEASLSRVVLSTMPGSWPILMPNLKKMIPVIEDEISSLGMKAGKIHPARWICDALRRPLTRYKNLPLQLLESSLDFGAQSPGKWGTLKAEAFGRDSKAPVYVKFETPEANLILTTGENS